MIRAPLVLAGAMFAAGCATDRVTLLENEAGNETGALAVLASDGRETVIDRANSQAALRDGPTRVKAIDAIRPTHAALIEALPPGAKAFSIPFETGQAAIREDQRQVLELIRNEVSVRPGAQIEVAAFTDSVGSEDLNAQLSLERAQNVARELRGFGFPIADGDAIGRGEHDAIRQFGDEKDLPAFRRVDVIVR